MFGFMKKTITKEKKESKVEVSRIVDCSDCNGSGLKDPHNLCAPCEGSGKINK